MFLNGLTDGQWIMKTGVTDMYLITQVMQILIAVHSLNLALVYGMFHLVKNSVHLFAKSQKVY